MIQNNLANIHYPPTVDEFTALCSTPPTPPPLMLGLARLLALANETLVHVTQAETLNVFQQLCLPSCTSIICHEKSTLCVATDLQTWPLNPAHSLAPAQLTPSKAEPAG